MMRTIALHNDTRDRAQAVMALLAGLARWARRQRAISRTVRELSAMTDRELADLGILRCDIRRLARQAVD